MTKLQWMWMIEQIGFSKSPSKHLPCLSCPFFPTLPLVQFGFKLVLCNASYLSLSLSAAALFFAAVPIDYRPTNKFVLYTLQPKSFLLKFYPSCRSNKEDPLHLTHIFFFPQPQQQTHQLTPFLNNTTIFFSFFPYFLSAFYYTYNMLLFSFFLFLYIYTYNTYIYIFAMNIFYVFVNNFFFSFHSSHLYQRLYTNCLLYPSAKGEKKGIPKKRLMSCNANAVRPETRGSVFELRRFRYDDDYAVVGEYTMLLL